MSTSEMQRYVRTISTAFDANEAIDAGLYHDLLDSLAHLTDQMGQVRVNFPLSSGNFLATQTPTSNSTWYPIAVLAIFPITCKPDLTPFVLRARMTGYVSANKSVTFRMVLAPAGQSSDYASRATAPANVMEASTSSLTPADLSPASNLLTLASNEVITARRPIAVYDAVSSASPVTVDVAMVEVSVWAKTSDITATPQLAAAYAAEYVGL